MDGFGDEDVVGSAPQNDEFLANVWVRGEQVRKVTPSILHGPG